MSEFEKPQGIPGRTGCQVTESEACVKSGKKDGEYQKADEMGTESQVTKKGSSCLKFRLND